MNLLEATFQSKDEYLAWRTTWRAEYARLSLYIRVLRQVTADHCRNPALRYDEKQQSWVRQRPWTDAEAVRQEQCKEASAFSKHIWSAHQRGLSSYATLLLARRHWSKEESQRQYLEAQARKIAA